MRSISTTDTIRSFSTPARWSRRAKSAMSFAIHGSYLQDWLFMATDWNWRLVPELSGDSRAIADIGSHWCDLLQFITGLTITKVFADLRTVHKTRMKPKKEVETYAGKVLAPEDYEPQAINTEDYASVLFELSNGAHGVFTVSQVSAGRKNRLYFRNRRFQVCVGLGPGKPERNVDRLPR